MRDLDVQRCEHGAMYLGWPGLPFYLLLEVPLFAAVRKKIVLMMLLGLQRVGDACLGAVCRRMI